MVNNYCCTCPRSPLRIWSRRQTSLAVPSRQPASLHTQTESIHSFLSSLSLIPLSTAFLSFFPFHDDRDRCHHAIMPSWRLMPSIHAVNRHTYIRIIVLRHRASPEFIGSRICEPMAFTTPKVRRYRVSSPQQGDSSNGCCLLR